MKAYKKGIKRKYYKYVYDYTSWTQPVPTSNNYDGIIFSATSVRSGEAARQPYRAWTNIQFGWQSTSSDRATWTCKLPYKLKITGISTTTHDIGAFFANEEQTIPIGNPYTTRKTSGGAEAVTGIPTNGIITDTIVFQKATTGQYTGLIGMVVTATKEIVTVIESTEDDYDYYIDTSIYKVPKKNDKYYGINQ